MEAEAEAKKFESLWAEAEEEKADIAEEARHAISTLSEQWAESVAHIHSSILSQIDSLTTRVETVSNSLPRVHGAAVGWKMRAWEAEGLVHQLETEKLKLKEKSAITQEPSSSPTREMQRLAAKLWQEETKARHLESSLRNEKDHASKIINGKRSFCSIFSWLYFFAWTCFKGLICKPLHIYFCVIKFFGGLAVQMTLDFF